ncbi:MAG TPA: hypothetical protein V6D15_09505 [Oculatellaceae cyanobacterium]|jgi:hypothetical protein
MKKLKNKQHQLNKSQQKKRKESNYNRSRNLGDTRTTLKWVTEQASEARQIAARETAKRLIKAEMRVDWLKNYNYRLFLLHQKALKFIKRNNDLGAISLEYISTDCQDYLPLGAPTTIDSHLEFNMHVRNNVIVDVSLGFEPIELFQQQLKDLQQEKLEYTPDIVNADYFIEQIDGYIASTERTIDLIQKCDRSTHRVICIPGVEALIVLIESIEIGSSIFDEHDLHWVCGFGADYICVGNLEKCLNLCNYINEDVDKPLLKKVCLHTGDGRALSSSIEWNPVRAEKLRKDYKHDVDEDGSLIVAP